LNPVDWKILYYNWTSMNLPSTLGVDVAGTVRQVGRDVKDLKVGDRVCGVLNLWKTGSFAENCVTESYCLTKISDVPFETAASLPVTFLSAWEAFMKPDVKRMIETKTTKHTVYIAGGGGGVGHMAIQIAKYFGFTVISSGSKEDSLRVIKTAGADHIINYKKEDVVFAVQKIVGDKGCDMIFDSTYDPTSFAQSAKVLKQGGLFVLLGPAPSNDSEAAKIASEKKATVLLSDLVPIFKSDAKTQQTHIQGGLSSAIKMIHERKLTPHITTINLDEVPRALENMKAHGAVGKIVVKVKGVHSLH